MCLSNVENCYVTSLLAIFFFFWGKLLLKHEAFLCLFDRLVIVGGMSQQANASAYFSTRFLQLLSEIGARFVNISEGERLP